MNSKGESRAAGEGSLLDSFHVILVETEDNLNIGSVARAMSNLGFRHLHLVAPRDFSPAVAARTACWGAPLLERVVLHASLEEAVAPLNDVIAFTARHSRDRRPHLMLSEWAAALSESCSCSIGLVFGSESHGLSNKHLTNCRLLLRIPSTAENPSYNLAQAVLLALFEIYRNCGNLRPAGRATVPAEKMQRLDQLVSETLRISEFYREDSPPPVEAIISNLLRRIQPDERELGILMALFSHLNTTLRRGS